MVQTHSKRQKNIKSKLMAAICMLLVSSIMMVSSTYAWFTLSTAPEVTGISTAVGANGNLEMALLPTSGALADINSSVGDSTKAASVKNVTWGNLVDLSDTTFYGMDKIVLNPAALNITDAGVLGDSLLKTPTYGSDGRVDTLLANTVTGVYNTKSFNPDDQFGVRAVGTASGMTDRELAYRNTRSAANTAVSVAKNEATLTLTTNGAALADLAIAHGLAEANEAYTWAQIQPLATMISDLETKVLPQVEKAYMQYILAYLASSLNPADDAAWAAQNGTLITKTTLADLVSAVGEANLPAAVSTGIAKYNASVTAVATAKGALPPDTTQDSYAWTEFNGALNALMDSGAMEVNDLTIAEVKADKQKLVDSYLATQSLTLTIATGGGIFADIADQCGDYSASIKINVVYGDMKLNNVPSTMKTATSQSPAYLTAIGAVVENKAPAHVGGAEVPITDLYGYVIDLAFRTNAASSDLMLQVDAADRIYSDNANEETMGHGSSMTFKATTDSFSNEQVLNLMKSIRVVFFNPDGGAIHTYGKLDVSTAVLSADGYTASIRLYTPGNSSTSTTTYVKATAYADGTTYYTLTTTPAEYTEVDPTALAGYKDGTTTGTLYDTTYTAVKDNSGIDTTGTYYLQTKAAEEKYTEAAAGTVTADNVTNYYVANTASSNADGDVIIDKDKSTIMPLTQNTAAKLSVLVYLDGESITNAAVAASASTSVTGTMNLQFASSATLVPMEYTALHQTGTVNPDDSVNNDPTP